MAIKTFTVGKVLVNANTLSNVETTTPTITINTGETTSIGDTWRKLVATGKSWAVTIVVKKDPSNTAYAAIRTEFLTGDGLITTLSIYEDATKYITGSAYLTQFAPTKSVGNVDSTSITFEGIGMPSYV